MTDISEEAPEAPEAIAFWMGPCSPEAQLVIDKYWRDADKERKNFYPFKSLEVGQCFIVPYSAIVGSKDKISKSNSLRVGAAKRKVTTGSVYRVMDHPTLNCYEVFRIT